MKVSSWFPIAAFWALVATVLYLGQVPSHIDAPPFSTHAWRQADGAAQYYHFYNTDLPPWKPKVFNLTAKDGHVISEIPILYWLAGQWAKLFGYRDAWLRAFHLLIFLAGLYYFRKICLLYIKDNWLASLPPLLYLASPPVLYYAFSSLPNVPAIGMVLIGWSIYFQALHKRQLRTKTYGWVIFWLLLACLLKASEGIHFVAFIIVESLRLLGWVRQERTPSVGNKKPLAATLLILGLAFVIAIAGYQYYVYQFNLHYGNTLNLQGIIPIWEEDLANLPKRLRYLDKVFRRDFMNDLTTYLLVVMLLWLMLRKQSWRSTIGLTTMLLVIGTLCYAGLFFGAFTMHDYYYLTLGPALIFLPVAFFATLSPPPQWGKYLPWLIVAFALYLTAANLDHLNRKISSRFAKNSKSLPNPGFNDKADQLRKAGIDPKEPMIIFGDISPNVGLYYLKQMGWSTYFPKNTFKRLLPYRKQGLVYVSFTGPTAENKYSDFAAELGDLVVEIDSLKVYDLKPLE